MLRESIDGQLFGLALKRFRAEPILLSPKHAISTASETAGKPLFLP